MDMEKILEKKGVEPKDSDDRSIYDYLRSRNEYASLYGKKVGVILQAKGRLSQYSRTVQNLALEGTLDSETEANIRLTEVVLAEGYSYPGMKSGEMYIRKDKLVAIYSLE